MSEHTRRPVGLLRDGADLHAKADVDGPTPLSLANAMQARGAAADGSAAALVLRAALPWSPQTHDLFPTASRAYAVEMLLMGHRMSRESRFGGESVALFDAWMVAVMPHLVQRRLCGGEKPKPPEAETDAQQDIAPSHHSL